jgi:predicted aconitase
MVGVTPEAQRLADVADPSLTPAATIAEADLRAFQGAYRSGIDQVDVVVFSTPQLSLLELRALAGMLDGRCTTVPLLVVTSPQVKPDADRLGITARIEATGGLVLSGMCFYQSYAREMAEANGWQSLVTNSAKLVNILGGYGYRPALLSMQECVDAACTGRIA